MTHQEAEVGGVKIIGINLDELSGYLICGKSVVEINLGPDPEEPSEDEDRISAIWRNETDKREGWVKRTPVFNPFARVAQLDQAACFVGPKVKA